MLSKNCHHLSPSSIRDVPYPPNLSLFPWHWIMVLERQETGLYADSTGINDNVGNAVGMGTPRSTLLLWSSKAMSVPNSFERLWRLLRSRSLQGIHSANTKNLLCVGHDAWCWMRKTPWTANKIRGLRAGTRCHYLYDTVSVFPCQARIYSAWNVQLFFTSSHFVQFLN